MRLSEKLAAKTVNLGGSLPPMPDSPLAEGERHGVQYMEIATDRIEPNPDQPRRDFDQAAIESLAVSIGEHGLIEPLIVRLMGDHVGLIAGERRLRAAKLAGLARVPCLVNNHGDSAVLALVENLHRQDLTPMEEAEALGKLRDRGMSLANLAAVAGKSVSTVSEILSLANLPEPVKAQATAQPAQFPRRLLVELAKQRPEYAEVLASKIAEGQGPSAEQVRAERKASKAQKPTKGPQAAGPWPPPSPSQPYISPELAAARETERLEAIFRRAEGLASDLGTVDLEDRDSSELEFARACLAPLARAMDRVFHQLKRLELARFKAAQE